MEHDVHLSLFVKVKEGASLRDALFAATQHAVNTLAESTTVPQTAWSDEGKADVSVFWSNDPHVPSSWTFLGQPASDAD